MGECAAREGETLRRKRGGESVFLCVCVRERERERGRGVGRKRAREREQERERARARERDLEGEAPACQNSPTTDVKETHMKANKTWKVKLQRAMSL